MHFNITHNSQLMEINLVSVDYWKRNVTYMYTHMYISYVYDKCIIYTHNRVSFNLKEENPDICHCDNMDRPGSHYIKWNKPEKDK